MQTQRAGRDHQRITITRQGMRIPSLKGPVTEYHKEYSKANE